MDGLLIIIAVSVGGVILLFILKGLPQMQQKPDKIKMTPFGNRAKMIDERFGEGRIVGHEIQSAHSFDLFIDMGTPLKQNVKKIPYHSWQIEPLNILDAMTSEEPSFIFRDNKILGESNNEYQKREFTQYNKEKANTQRRTQESDGDVLRKVDNILERISGGEKAKQEKEVVKRG